MLHRNGPLLGDPNAGAALLSPAADKSAILAKAPAPPIAASSDGNLILQRRDIYRNVEDGRNEFASTGGQVWLCRP
jgi:hypothetical protein